MIYRERTARKGITIRCAHAGNVLKGICVNCGEPTEIPGNSCSGSTVSNTRSITGELIELLPGYRTEVPIGKSWLCCQRAGNGQNSG